MTLRCVAGRWPNVRYSACADVHRALCQEPVRPDEDSRRLPAVLALSVRCQQDVSNSVTLGGTSEHQTARLARVDQAADLRKQLTTCEVAGGEGTSRPVSRVQAPSESDGLRWQPARGRSWTEAGRTARCRCITDRQWARLELALVVGESERATDRPLEGLARAPAALRPQSRPRRRSAPAMANPGPLRRSKVPELHGLPAPSRPWREELLAYWTATGRRGPSNGPTEAHQRLIRKTRRVGHGFPQLRQLPPPAADEFQPGLQHRALAGSACHPDPRPLATPGGVEPRCECDPPADT